MFPHSFRPLECTDQYGVQDLPVQGPAECLPDAAQSIQSAAREAPHLSAADLSSLSPPDLLLQHELTIHSLDSAAHFNVLTAANVVTSFTALVQYLYQALLMPKTPRLRPRIVCRRRLRRHTRIFASKRRTAHSWSSFLNQHNAAVHSASVRTPPFYDSYEEYQFAPGDMNQFPPLAPTYEDDKQSPPQASSPPCQSETDNTYMQQASSSAHQLDSASLFLQLSVPRLEQKDTPPQPAKSSARRSKSQAQQRPHLLQYRTANNCTSRSHMA